MAYSRRVAEAFALAHELHEQQVRKGTALPYLVHLTAVAGIVGDYGGTEDQFIAALLHDAVEDQGGQATLSRIRAQFGDAVADLVWQCSDTDVEPKPPWSERKKAAIEHTRRLAPSAKLILAADKLHNAQAILRDAETHGAAIFERFTGTREQTIWYYQAELDALGEGWDHPILKPLARAVARMNEID